MEQANTGGIVDGVCDYGPHADHGRLATTLRRFIFRVHDNRLNFRQPGKPRDRVRIEVMGVNVAAGELNLFGQRVSQAPARRLKQRIGPRPNPLILPLHFDSGGSTMLAVEAKG